MNCLGWPYHTPHSVVLSHFITGTSGTYGTTCIPDIPELALYFIASLYSIVVVYIGIRILFGSRKKSRTRTSSITLTNASSKPLIKVLL